MKQRLLFVTSGLGTGGAERMLVKLLAALDRTRCECLVVSLLDAGTQGGPIREIGVPVLELRIDRLGGFLAAGWQLLRIARRFRPHVVQGWMYHGNLAAAWAWLAVCRSARLFWGVRQTFHGMAAERPLTRLAIRAGAALSGMPAAIIFNSHVSAAQHDAIGFRRDKAAVIPNGFDLERFRPDAETRARIRSTLDIPPTAPVVGLVARDHPMKDHDTFLEAAALIARQLPDAVFVLAGRNIDRANQRIAQKIAALGLAAALRLLGEVRDTESLYPAFDVLALSSSRGEAFPNVLGEAMACGVPCVATDVGDARSIIGDTGGIVPVADPAALAEEILALLRLPETERCAFGKRARERVRRLYSLDSVAIAYRDCWDCHASGVIQGEDRPGAAPPGTGA